MRTEYVGVRFTLLLFVILDVFVKHNNVFPKTVYSGTSVVVIIPFKKSLECTKTEAIFPIRNNVNPINQFKTPKDINKKYIL